MLLLLLLLLWWWWVVRGGRQAETDGELTSCGVGVEYGNLERESSSPGSSYATERLGAVHGSFLAVITAPPPFTGEGNF
jgi:hypothetical protein